MENSGLPSIEVNLLFSLNDLFEDCETIDDTKPIFEKLKEVINNSVNLLDDYDFELTSMVSFEDLRKVLNKKYNMFKIESLKFDDGDIIDIFGPPPPNNFFCDSLLGDSKFGIFFTEFNKYTKIYIIIKIIIPSYPILFRIWKIILKIFFNKSNE